MLDRNNMKNVGGFVLATDYYNLPQETQEQYYSCVIFDSSTKEIIVNTESYGYARLAKEEMAHDISVLNSYI